MQQLLLDCPRVFSFSQTGIVLNRPVLRGEDGDKAAPPPMSAQVRRRSNLIRFFSTQSSPSSERTGDAPSPLGREVH